MGDKIYSVKHKKVVGVLNIIQGQITLVQYFMALLVSTILLVAVVAAAYFLPHDKHLVAMLVMALSAVSLLSSSKIIRLTLHNQDY
jgi:hypothetical protein